MTNMDVSRPIQTSIVDTTNAPAANRVERPAARLPLKYLLLLCELLLLLKVVQVFEIEGRRNLLSLMCLAVGGFAIHYQLSAKFRPGFFLFLSFIAFIVLLGWQSAASLVGVGLLLFAVCHLPIGLKWRVLILMLLAGVLAYSRIYWPLPFWPILGSIFMFRLAIYLRAKDRPKRDVDWSQRLSYFFLLPNVCFPFFPLIDYQVFINSYRNEEDLVIAQKGIAWILRGILQLILYRLVKYQLLPPPLDILNVSDLVLFLIGNYALYLHVSGAFHVITGILHLFGFNLPRTHDWFFLAHSFTDIWRRINIYWKDFITQHIFFPTFFKARQASNEVGIVTAVFVAFASTWLLHSYQVFWLLGHFPLRRADAALWTIAGLLVAINAVVDYRVARRLDSRRVSLSISHALRKSLQIVAVFLCVSVFWACWSYPLILPGLLSAIRQSSNFSEGWTRIVMLSLFALVSLTGFQLLHARLTGWGWQFAFRFDKSPVSVFATSLCLIVLSQPMFQQQFHTDTARILASLTVDYPTTLDLVRSVPGYYEELTDANLQSDALLSTEQPRPRKGELIFTDMTRSRNDLMELELIPNWRGVMAGVPISINRWGMRDGPVSREKPANTTRVAVVGSSVVMGYGVRESEVFTEIVEQRLNRTQATEGHRFELLNFGVGKYYPLHIAASLREKVFSFDPDAVYYVAHQGEYYGPISHVAKYRFARYSLLYSCLDDIVRKAGITDETPWGSMEHLLLPHAKQITRCIYEGIVADCRARGILPVWIYMPVPGVVEVSMNTEEIVSLAEQTGFVVIDLSHWADGRKPEEVKLATSDYHANALGHQLIADELFKALVTRQKVLAVKKR